MLQGALADGKEVTGIGMGFAAKHNRSLNIILSFTVVSCLVLSFLASCSENTPPSDLLGVWRTTDENYNDRYLEIKPDSLIFGVGEGQEMVNVISTISSERESQGMRYTFHYLDRDGEKWTLSLLYNSEDGGTIVIQNRHEVWMKEEQP